ncbi:MAG: hypothetical protein ABI901_08780, partial [Roseiflexaceae bacterium]
MSKRTSTYNHRLWLGLLIVLLLAACGGQAPQTPPAQEAPTAVPAAAAPTAAPAAAAPTVVPAAAAPTAAPAAPPTAAPAAAANLPVLEYHFAASGAPNALKDLDEVEAAINALLAPKIGATLKLHPYSFTEAAQKINLVLQSGDPCDLVSVSGFVPFVPAVNTGGLAALDELLPKDAPNLWARIKPEWWNAARV